jgi:hypothetical protein
MSLPRVLNPKTESVLNLEDKTVIYILIALDSELNRLHRFCVEQGPFFKTCFAEFLSDFARYNLKDNASHKSPNMSHTSRLYWKRTVRINDIVDISVKIHKLRTSWDFLHDRLQKSRIDPKLGPPVYGENGVYDVWTDFHSLTTGILEICESLMGRTGSYYCLALNEPGLNSLLNQLEASLTVD